MSYRSNVSALAPKVNFQESSTSVGTYSGYYYNTVGFGTLGGQGYAGGIVSAAMDGEKVAEAIFQKINSALD